jgi:hypothetical protein
LCTVVVYELLLLACHRTMKKQFCQQWQHLCFWLLHSQNQVMECHFRQHETISRNEGMYPLGYNAIYHIKDQPTLCFLSQKAELCITVVTRMSDHIQQKCFCNLYVVMELMLAYALNIHIMIIVYLR